jgi:acetolactate synthase-1/2/3 large subunit
MTVLPAKAATFAPNASIVHVDIDPSEIGKNIEVDVPIVGDAKLVLLSLLEEEPEDTKVAQFHHAAAEWLVYVRELQAKHQHKQQYLNRPDTSVMMPHGCVSRCSPKN